MSAQRGGEEQDCTQFAVTFLAKMFIRRFHGNGHAYG